MEILTKVSLLLLYNLTFYVLGREVYSLYEKDNIKVEMLYLYIIFSMEQMLHTPDHTPEFEEVLITLL